MSFISGGFLIGGWGIGWLLVVLVCFIIVGFRLGRIGEDNRSKTLYNVSTGILVTSGLLTAALVIANVRNDVATDTETHTFPVMSVEPSGDDWSILVEDEKGKLLNIVAHGSDVEVRVVDGTESVAVETVTEMRLDTCLMICLPRQDRVTYEVVVPEAP